MALTIRLSAGRFVAQEEVDNAVDAIWDFATLRRKKLKLCLFIFIIFVMPEKCITKITHLIPSVL